MLENQTYLVWLEPKAEIRTQGWILWLHGAYESLQKCSYIYGIILKILKIEKVE